MDCFSCRYKIHICPSPSGQQDCGGIFLLVCVCVCVMRVSRTYVLGVHHPISELLLLPVHVHS